MKSDKSHIGVTEPDVKFKIRVMGDKGNGKTSLMQCYDKNWNKDLSDDSIKVTEQDGISIKNVVTETKLNDPHWKKEMSQLEQANGFVLTFDVTNRKSFDHIDKALR